jgi:hypothetical protein
MGWATFWAIFHKPVWSPCRTWLPDGLFSNQKYQFGKILEGLAMEVVGVFHVHLVYVMAIWYIL